MQKRINESDDDDDNDDGNEVELLFIERSQRIYLVENQIPPLW